MGTITERRARRVAPGLLAASLLAAAAAGAGLGPVPAAIPEAGAAPQPTRLPLAFAAPARGDRGFVARGAGYAAVVSARGARLALEPGRSAPTEVEIRLHRANGSPGEGKRRLPGEVNQLIGPPSEWRRGVPTYGRVEFADAWEGIDAVWHGDGNRLEYDFEVGPRADPDRIALRFPAAGVRVGARGDLLIRIGGEVLRQRRPIAFQRSDGRRTRVDAAYRVGRHGTVGFELGAYDRGRPLTIDPLLLTYSTFLGSGGADAARAIAVDSAGAAYVAGVAPDVTDVFPSTPGAFDASHNGGTDAFVTKLAPDGRSIAYSTFLGGAADDAANAIDVDSAGAAYVGGQTVDAPTDFPTTAGAFDTAHNGQRDGFVAKLTPSGAGLTYSTLLGGAAGDEVLGLDAGNATTVVTGHTADPAAGVEFPTTAGSFDTGRNGGSDAFLTKLSLSGSALVYSTFLGGSGSDQGHDVAMNASGSAFVTGQTENSATDFPTTAGDFDTSHNGSYDAFVSRVTANGSVLAYSTFLGGDAVDRGSAIAIDSAEAAYVVGRTSDGATDLPTTVGAVDAQHNGSSDGFVAKLRFDADELLYSTFIGGAMADEAMGVAVDGAGRAHVVGATASPDLPTTAGAFDRTHNGGTDAFAATLAADATEITDSTYLGGAGDDAALANALGPGGADHVAGSTDDAATDFPTTAGSFEPAHSGATDGFVVRLAPSACSDGADNDGDGRIDFPTDPGCANAGDDDESEPAPPAPATPEPDPAPPAPDPPPDSAPEGEAPPEDALAPETRIVKGPKRATRKRRAKVAFASSEAGSSFECALDRKPFRTCSSPSRLRRLAGGRHRFRVRSIDAAGNVDPTPAIARWRVARR